MTLRILWHLQSYYSRIKIGQIGNLKRTRQTCFRIKHETLSLWLTKCCKCPCIKTEINHSSLYVGANSCRISQRHLHVRQEEWDNSIKSLNMSIVQIIVLNVIFEELVGIQRLVELECSVKTCLASLMMLMLDGLRTNRYLISKLIIFQWSLGIIHIA